MASSIIPPDIQAMRVKIIWSFVFSPTNDDVHSAGPSLLGYVFNWGLYGALSVQVYMYYMSFPKDKNMIKALVYGLYVLETIQTILITHDLFHVYAFGWGNLEILGEIGFTWISVPIFDGIVSFIVQMFFAYRISVLSGSKSIGGIVCLIACTQLAAALVGGAQAKMAGNFQELQAKSFVSTAIWLSGSAACDVVIAVSMCYFLSKKNIAFKSTQVMVDRLVRLTIETGSLTATIATVDLILFLSFRDQNYHTTPAITLGKLYSNTLLLIFNSRIRVVGGRNTSNTSEFMELTTTKITSSNIRNPNTAKINASHNMTDAINVSQSQWTDSDNRSNDAKLKYLSDDQNGIESSVALDETGTKRDRNWDRV